MKQLILIFAIAAIFAGCMPKENNKANEQIAKNKAGMMRFMDEVMNKHNPAMIDSLCTDDFLEHYPDPGMAPTRDGLKKGMIDFFTAFPDLNIKTNYLVADSDLVVLHYTMTGTNTGPMMGMPPTNKKVTVDGVDIVRFKDGKGCEHWGFWQETKFMTEMGMMPDMSQMMNMKDSSKMKMDK